MPPASLLETEVALRVAEAVQRAGYELQVSPRGDAAADLGAARHGTVWATFHLGYDRQRPLFVRVGATVWGGARADFPQLLAYDDAAAARDGRLDAFAADRLALACRKGLAEDPGHCDACPVGDRHRAGDFTPGP